MLFFYNIELNCKYLFEYGQSEFEGIIKYELCYYYFYFEGKGYKYRDKDFRELFQKVGVLRFCMLL